MAAPQSNRVLKKFLELDTAMDHECKKLKRQLEHMMKQENYSSMQPTARLLDNVKSIRKRVNDEYTHWQSMTNCDTQQLDEDIELSAETTKYSHSANPPSIEQMERVRDILGGGAPLKKSGHHTSCRLNDRRHITYKRSMYHENARDYWYGITPPLLSYIKKNKITDLVFIMGEEGFVIVPMSTVHAYIRNTSKSYTENDVIRHYNCKISPGPSPVFKTSTEGKNRSLESYYHSF